jgi:putative transposase
MPNYIRAYIPGGTYFFTVNLLERKRLLLVEHIESLRNAFRLVKQQRPFHIEAIVILPDHLHWVCIPTQGHEKE